MAKVLCAVLCLVLAAVAEPPSSYLPPQARNSPSGQYGAPQQQQRSNGFSGQSSGRSFSYNSLAENQFGGSSRSSSRGRLGASGRQQPSQQYGAPSNGFDDSVVTNAGRTSASRNFGPSQDFGAPRGFAPTHFGSATGRQQRPAPTGRQQELAPFGRNQQPASQYNAPSVRNQQPASQYNAPSARNQQPASQYNAPSARNQQPASSYAAAARQQPSAQYGAPAPQYGAPFGRSQMDDDLAEPANYEYNYEVQADEESGAQFGHQETREDDFAQGEYHVLLPDGRMQIVEYEADEEGFRPKIRYEETGYPDARDNQGPY